ncbi:MAG: hypothetical protein ACR2MX_07680 [Cyclobacteriaceae bacterium]
MINLKKAGLKYFLPLLLVLVAIGCKTRQSEISSANYQARAQTALGSGLLYEMNADSTMVLCQKVTSSASEAHRQNVKYLVINLQEDSVIHQAEIQNGTVAWYNNTQLKVRNYLGYPAVNNEGLYIFDLLKKKRTKLPVDKE